MNKLLAILIFLILAGCAGLPHPDPSGKEMIEYKQAIWVREEQLARMEQEIKILQASLAEKEAQLKEKEAKIEELKSKLSSFGVF